MGSQLSHNYALALYELVPFDALKTYQKKLAEFSHCLKDDKDLRLFLESYSIPLGKKEELIKKIFEGDEATHLASFICLIAKKHRIGIFEEINEEFSSMVNEAFFEAEGKVYTSYRLEKKDLEAIESAFSKRLGKKVHLKNIVEPSILGGVKVLLEGKVYDGSLRNKLLEMEKSLLESR